MAVLRIVRGWPGSGKSTFAKKMFSGTLLLENDQFLIQDGQYKWSKEGVKDAIGLCTEIARMALENGSDVVVANTFTKKMYIAAYKNIAERCGAKLEVYRCIGCFQNVHGLSEKMVDNFKSAMEDWPGETFVEPTEKQER